MLRIAVCDDDVSFTRSFLTLLNHTFHKAHIECVLKDFIRCDLMLNRHQKDPFDVIFLDIDMPDVHGFTAAKELTEINERCNIVFVTSHTELVYDSFDFRPLNFIIKSDDNSMRNKLNKVVDQLSHQILQNETVVLENKDRGRISVYLRDIVYIESNNHNVLYFLANTGESISIRDRISDLESKYGDKHFVRIHKKYLVNLRYVFNIDLTKETVT